MKVALVICPQAHPDKPPLSLAYLGVYLQQRNIDVICLDFNIDLYHRMETSQKNLWDPAMDVEWRDWHRYNSLNLIDDSVIEHWIKEIEKVSPQIIGFSVLYTNIYSTLKLIKKIKSRNREIKIILGGPEVYRLYGAKSHYDMFHYADILILGEGEERLFKVVTDLSNKGKIESSNGVMLNEYSKFSDERNLSLLTNINEIPFPNYDWFIFEQYKEKGMQLPLIFSRGCVNRCAFCFESAFWQKFRCRSVENVIAEIRTMQEKYGVRSFALNDSLINGNMQFLDEFCDRIILEGIDIHWWGMARINSQMSDKFLEKMIKAGCVQIAYGIESGSQKVLDLMNKGYSVTNIDEVLINTYRAGIKPGINLLLGFPGEEEEDFQQTRELIKRNGKYISYVNISTLGIEPYTDIYVNKTKWNIEFKDGTNWYSKDGKNTYQIRMERSRRLSQIVQEYVGKVVCFE